MLINIPGEPKYNGLEKGDPIAVMQDGNFLCNGRIYEKYSSIIVVEVDPKVWRLYNEQLSSYLKY